MIEALSSYLETNCIRATYVTLTGQIVVCGFNTRSLDSSRDLCALHLHLRTGGVFVQRDDSLTYLSASVISHAELDANYEGITSVSGQANAGALDFAQYHKEFKALAASDYEDPPKAPLTREDEILAEIDASAVTKKVEPVKSRRKVRG